MSDRWCSREQSLRGDLVDAGSRPRRPSAPPAASSPRRSTATTAGSGKRSTFTGASLTPLLLDQSVGRPGDPRPGNTGSPATTWMIAAIPRLRASPDELSFAIHVRSPSCMDTQPAAGSPRRREGRRRGRSGCPRSGTSRRSRRMAGRGSAPRAPARERSHRPGTPRGRVPGAPGPRWSSAPAASYSGERLSLVSLQRGQIPGEDPDKAEVVVGISQQDRIAEGSSRQRESVLVRLPGGRDVVAPVRQPALRGERRDPGPWVGDRRGQETREEVARLAQVCAVLEPSPCRADDPHPESAGSPDRPATSAPPHGGCAARGPTGAGWPRRPVPGVARPRRLGEGRDVARVRGPSKRARSPCSSSRSWAVVHGAADAARSGPRRRRPGNESSGWIRTRLLSVSDASASASPESGNATLLRRS